MSSATGGRGRGRGAHVAGEEGLRAEARAGHPYVSVSCCLHSVILLCGMGNHATSVWLARRQGRRQSRELLNNQHLS